ncbi:MAG: pyrroloquinoline quinone biosynthesis peptide chaperone PqqD [Janthinobacterium lividum]
MNEASIPVFVRGTRFQHDKARDQWVVLAPEKAFLPDPIAVEILKLVDGSRSIGDIIDTLTARFEAPRATIATDVIELATDLGRRRLLQA